MSARDLAAKVQPGSIVRWDRLERAAFAAHPWVLEKNAADKKVNQFNKINLIWVVPVVLLYLFCYTAPIWGAAAISDRNFQTHHQSAAERIPLSGTMFIFAVVS